MNVYAVITDKKQLVIPTNGGISYFKADLVTANDYFPFGLVVEDRNANVSDTRFKFQGQEQDEEWLGGQAVNYKYRVHDPRVGRFLSIDPLAPSFPHNSPYAFSENRVIDGIELEGAEVLLGPMNTPLLGTSTVEVLVRSPISETGLWRPALGRVGSSEVNVPLWPLIPPAEVSPTHTGTSTVPKTEDGSSAAPTHPIPHSRGGISPEAIREWELKKAEELEQQRSGAEYWNQANEAFERNMRGETEEEAPDRDVSVQKESGSYTNTHESGKTYHGKGGQKRANQSAKEKAEKYDDPLKEQDWTPAKNSREAFKQESRRLEQDKVGDTPGHKNPNNYNIRKSPGDKYIQQDGG